MRIHFKTKEIQQGATRLGLTSEALAFCQSAPSVEEANQRLADLRKQVKKTYRKLSLELHPDRNLDNQSKTEEFKVLSVAYTEVDKFLSKARVEKRPIRPIVRVHINTTYGSETSTTATTFGSNWWSKYTTS